jgi:hypothetical protein
MLRCSTLERSGMLDSDGLTAKIGVGEGTFRLHHFTFDFTPNTRINTASSCAKIRDLMRNK